MCSVFESLNMDNNFQGDLTDVVRGIGSGHVSPSPAPTPEEPSPSSVSPSHVHVEFPSLASCQLNPFGDPFVSMTDPLLHHHLTANSVDYFSGAGDDNNNNNNNNNNSFVIMPKVFENDHEFSVFPRIRISQSNIIHEASTCSSPVVAVSASAVTAAVASPWGMINVDNTNSPRNCLLVDKNNNNNNTSSSSQIQISSSSSPRNLGIKRRKSQAKKVVCIPAPAAMNSRSGGEVVPSDLWAWRKYGQKPIKGSPHPRGYYRCSSSKGCSARKQVERSRTDSNMLVITYTSEHNHPWPTQRNALAGSTRSTSTPNANAKANATASSSRVVVLSQNKEVPNDKPHLPSSSSTLPSPPCGVVKEENVEERREDNMGNNVDEDNLYRPESTFFPDLDELEEDSLTMLLSRGFNGYSSNNLENKTMVPDVFSDLFNDNDYDDDDSSRSL